VNEIAPEFDFYPGKSGRRQISCSGRLRYFLKNSAGLLLP